MPVFDGHLHYQDPWEVLYIYNCRISNVEMNDKIICTSDTNWKLYLQAESAQGSLQWMMQSQIWPTNSVHLDSDV